MCNISQETINYLRENSDLVWKVWSEYPEEIRLIGRSLHNGDLAIVWEEYSNDETGETQGIADYGVDIELINRIPERVMQRKKELENQNVE